MFFLHCYVGSTIKPSATRSKGETSESTRSYRRSATPTHTHYPCLPDQITTAATAKQQLHCTRDGGDGDGGGGDGNDGKQQYAISIPTAPRTTR
jgi:hypothetical protein